MQFQPGTALLHYEIAAPLGAGGMGEVYRARDSKLDRDVAIKVLPPDFADDPERLARFEREAKSLAALNHPNIATIFGFEADQASGTHFLVMELVEGDDLADRIARGPIPVDDAIPLFVQIAEGLEAAHEKGIVHRDLKPANIKVDPDGRVKILDFGLAKAMDPARASDSADPNISQSPTMTAAATMRGEIMGTAAYMSPEQARGQAVDKRADIWAFGCCLFEALLARRPFPGDNPADIMAAILATDPECDGLSSVAPPAVERVIRRCLEKKPKQRLHDIADARIDLEGPHDEPVAAKPAAGGRAGMGVAAGLGAILGLIVAWAFWSQARGSIEPSREVVRSSLNLPADAPLALERAHRPVSMAYLALDLSPDGSTLVYVADVGDGRQLFSRQLDDFEATALEGTQGAFLPSFSPDGSEVAYATSQHLMVARVDGSSEPRVLCEASLVYSVDWSDDGWIYFNRHEFEFTRVAQQGGEPEKFGPSLAVARPSTLPGGGILFTQLLGKGRRLDHLPITHMSAQGELGPVIESGYDARYVPSGHLVFVRAESLMAVPFDLESLEVRGQPVRVLDGVRTDSIWGGSQFSFSDNGTLAYVAGGDFARAVPTWLYRDSDLEEALPAAPPNVYNQLHLSPDGNRLAIHVTGPTDHIFLYNFENGAFRQITNAEGGMYPVWTADSQSVVFNQMKASEDAGELMIQAWDGGAGAELLVGVEDLTDRAGVALASGASHDLVTFFAENAESQADAYAVSLDGSLPPTVLVETASRDYFPAISPDGRWLLFATDRYGDGDVFVQPYPDGGAEYQVSRGGGGDPIWSAASDEIFYRSANRIYSVPISSDSDSPVGEPRLVLEADFHDSAGLSFAVDPEATKFLVNKPLITGESVGEIRIIQNFFEELKRLAPVD